MNARTCCGNVTPLGASPAGGRAAEGLKVAKVIAPAAAADRRAATHPPESLHQQACAVRQGFKATAPQGLEPRPVGAETVSPEPSPRRRTTDASTPLALSNTPRGLNMEKNALDFICLPMKSFPVNHLRRQPSQNDAKQGKPMILRSYTLCEVPEKSRQELPMANKGTSNLPNRNLRLPNRTTSPS